MKFLSKRFGRKEKKIYLCTQKRASLLTLGHSSTLDGPRLTAVLQPEIVFIMSNSRTITIKNPSRKLEERIRKIGVQKYLWIEKLCSDETKPTKTIYV